MYYLGIDGGGTKVLCRLVNENKIIWETTYPGCNPSHNFKKALNTALTALSEAITKIPTGSDLSIAMGWAGLGSKSIREDFTNAILKESAPKSFKLKAVPDATTACYAAHGTKDGGIVIIGTGSIGWAVIGGKEHRWGGWGIDDGGSGSGYWLGKRALILATKAHDGLIKHSPLTKEILSNFQNNITKLSQTFFEEQNNNAYIASFAKRVVAHTKDQDPHAIFLMQEAAYRIEEFCIFGLQKKVPLALVGGLAPHIYPYLTEATQKQVTISEREPVEGAIMLAKSLP